MTWIVSRLYATFDREQNSGKITASYQTDLAVLLILVKYGLW